MDQSSSQGAPFCPVINSQCKKQKSLSCKINTPAPTPDKQNQQTQTPLHEQFKVAEW